MRSIIFVSQLHDGLMATCTSPILSLYTKSYISWSVLDIFEEHNKYDFNKDVIVPRQMLVLYLTIYFYSWTWYKSQNINNVIFSKRWCVKLRFKALWFRTHWMIPNSHGTCCAEKREWAFHSRPVFSRVEHYFNDDTKRTVFLLLWMLSNACKNGWRSIDCYRVAHFLFDRYNYCKPGYA